MLHLLWVRREFVNLGILVNSSVNTLAFLTSLGSQ